MEEDYVMIPGTGTKKIIRDVKKEIETAFLDYSMSVIVSRALPDVRDGLKPVHRRILFTMHERGNDPAHPYRKSADTVGAVLGSYHPHGDASVYDAMVRLAQDFLAAHLSRPHLLVDATCGNGGDTAFLCRLAGPQGRVLAFDIQDAALASTRARLAREGIDESLFRRLKKGVYGAKVRGLNSFENVCIELAQAHFAGVEYLTFPEVFDGISKADVEDRIRRWVTGERCGLAVIRPGETA